ncbi:MAG: hypothetical protein EP329_12020, partial [Deltaproteobacteria bacterium]
MTRLLLPVLFGFTLAACLENGAGRASRSSADPRSVTPVEGLAPTVPSGSTTRAGANRPARPTT